MMLFYDIELDINPNVKKNLNFFFFILNGLKVDFTTV